MFLSTEIKQEFHENGTLAYQETRAYLSPLSEHLYDRRIGYEGKTFIRIGQHVKFHNNGILDWELEYDNKGEIISSKKGFRKDGTPKIF